MSKRLEAFLRSAQASGSIFTKQEVSAATGYPLQTVKTYFSKFLLNDFVQVERGERFVSNGIERISSDEFKKHFSQVKTKKSNYPPTVLKLQKRSFDAYCLALESYNRPTLDNRVEAFCILMTNVWELLLKAEIIKTSGEEGIRYSNSDKTISISDALNLRFQQNDPILRNIETLIELRDNSIHLLLPELQGKLSRIFQSSVLNFRKIYTQYVGNFPLNVQPLGLMSLVSDSRDLEQPIIQKEYGQYTARMVSDFLKRLQNTEKELSSSDFVISLDYKMVLTKKESQGDTSLTVTENGEQAIIVNRAAPISQTHPHRATKAIELINKKSKATSPKINMSNFLALVNWSKIKENASYYNYEAISKTKSYSESLIEKFVNLLDSNPQALTKAKEAMRKK